MADGVVITVNKATKHMLENGVAASPGLHVFDIFPFIRPAWEVSAEQASVHREFERYFNGQRRWVVVHIQQVLNENGILQGKMILFRDVTEQKEAEIHLIESRKRIQELSALKSAFLSKMSHDVRTPLSGIIGLADVLQEETEGDQLELVGMIRASGDRLLKLLNSILSVSHLSSGTLDQNIEPTNVVALARDVLVQYERRHTKRESAFRNALPKKASFETWTRRISSTHSATFSIMPFDIPIPVAFQWTFEKRTPSS